MCKDVCGCLWACIWMCMVSMDMYECVWLSMHVYVCMHVYEYVCRRVSGICPAPAPEADIYGYIYIYIKKNIRMCRDVYDCLWACVLMCGVYGFVWICMDL